MRSVSAYLSTLTDISRQFQLENIRPQIAACSEMLTSGGFVDIAVLGQFKTGKSSFLNSLIGHEVLPVNVLPATAVITRVKYAATDRAVVRTHSGALSEIPLPLLPNYVTEQGNPRNIKRIELVDLELASLAPYRRIRFVDTPGLGSIFTHNTEASMTWLPRVGAAILAICATQPMGEHDMRLLMQLFKHTPEVSILLTKVDLLTERERQSVIDFTQSHIHHHTGRQLPIHPFSCQEGYEAFRRDVREYLLQHVVARHQELFAEVTGHKLSTLISDCRAYLLLAHRAALSAEDARSDLRALLRAEKMGLDSLRKEIRVLTVEMKTRVRTASGEQFHAHSAKVALRLRASLRELMDTWPGNLAQYTAAFQEWFSAALSEELTRISENGRSYLDGFLIAARNSLERTVRAFQDRLSKEIERALEMTFEGVRFHAAIEEPKSPDTRVGQVFDSHIDLLWFLIPMGIFRRLFQRHFLRLIPWEVEKNLARLSGQWAETVNASIDTLAQQAIESMQNELNTLETLVSNASDRRADIEFALRQLDAMTEFERSAKQEGATIHERQNCTGSSIRDSGITR